MLWYPSLCPTDKSFHKVNEPNGSSLVLTGKVLGHLYDGCHIPMSIYVVSSLKIIEINVASELERRNSQSHSTQVGWVGKENVGLIMVPASRGELTFLRGYGHQFHFLPSRPLLHRRGISSISYRLLKLMCYYHVIVIPPFATLIQSFNIRSVELESRKGPWQFWCLWVSSRQRRSFPAILSATSFIVI